MALKVLLSFVLVFFIISSSEAGEFKDEFKGPELREKFWVVKKVGNASYKIEGGKLILSSPRETDGIILYYREEVSEEGFSFEVMCDSSGIVNSGYVTTLKVMTPPERSEVYNPLRLAQFRLKPHSWRVRDENIRTVLDGKITPGMHTYKIELLKDTIKFYFDGKEVAEIPRIAEKRFFAVSPDPYAEDYRGELVIEYIKVSAPWITPVEADGKLATLWGRIKSR